MLWGPKNQQSQNLVKMRLLVENLNKRRHSFIINLNKRFLAKRRNKFGVGSGLWAMLVLSGLLICNLELRTYSCQAMLVFGTEGTFLY